MLRVLCFLVLAVHGAVSQTCVPEAISGLQLNAADTLSWQASTNCAGTGYVVNVLIGESLQSFFQLEETSIDLSYLQACVTYTFLITAVSNNVLSQAVFIQTPIRAQPDSSLAVSSLTATEQGADGVLLQWSFVQKFEPCIQNYRVTTWDGVIPVDTSYTPAKELSRDGLVPCTLYEFTVTPMFQAQLDGSISLVPYTSPAVTVPYPTLQSVSTGSTYADTVWILPSYSANPCPIASFVLDASPFINLTVPITDSSDRSPVTVRASPLASDSLYMFSVRVVNSGGASPPFHIGLHTLPPENN